MARELGIGGIERDVTKIALTLDRNRFQHNCATLAYRLSNFLFAPSNTLPGFRAISFFEDIQSDMAFVSCTAMMHRRLRSPFLVRECADTHCCFQPARIS